MNIRSAALLFALLPFPLSMLGGPMDTKILVVTTIAVLAALIVDQMFGVSSLLA